MFKKIVDDKIEIYYLAKNLCSDLDNQVDVYLFALTITIILKKSMLLYLQKI